MGLLFEKITEKASVKGHSVNFQLFFYPCILFLQPFYNVGGVFGSSSAEM